MKIGIDISSLQGPHRMRGIGYTAANFLKNLSDSADYEYIFYIEKTNDADINYITELLDISTENYSFCTFESNNNVSPKKRNHFVKAINKFSKLTVYKVGEAKYPGVKNLDVFLQLDQNMPMPRVGRKTKVYFIAYDLIPYIFEADYLPGYATCRQRGRSRKSALKSALNRYAYIAKIRANVKRAYKIIAISETTRQDFILHANAQPKKIKVVSLGINSPEKHDATTQVKLNRYHDTSWGYLPSPTPLEAGKFLLFVGGADERRRLNDLVSAFNHLKAQDFDLKLVLSGDIMKGPTHIPSSVIQKSLLSSSYLDDIYFVGFTDDTTRNWLYKNALAFVFPSVYEGFGLPVLEAMSYGTPVICYNTPAVREVAHTAPIYANDVHGIANAIKQILSANTEQRDNLKQRGLNQVKKYSWKKTAQQILTTISSTK
jgi:glycosyltransferase involved in cell wall biosynthesis